ncbi:MAG: Potassium/proton antiporter, CPA1 family, partial [uncultured bacterium]
PTDNRAPLTVEINALRHVDGEIVEYIVGLDSRAAGLALRDMALPYEVLVSLIVRNDDIMIPRGRSVLLPGDHVFITMRSKCKPLINCFFDSCAVDPQLSADLKLDFRADSTVEQLYRFFGISEPVVQGNRSIGSLIESEERGWQRVGSFMVSPGEKPGLVSLVYDPPISPVPRS